MGHSLGCCRSHKHYPQTRLCACLDLDSTLVYFDIDRPYDGKHGHRLPCLTNSGTLLVRPHLEEYLRQVSAMFDIVVYTAAAFEYAQDVLDVIDRGKTITTLLYRDHCSLLEDQNGESQYTKDLSRIQMNTANVVLVDDNKYSYCMYPENAIPISAWRGEMNDCELLKSLDVLKTVYRQHPHKSAVQTLGEIDKQYNWSRCADIANLLQGASINNEEEKLLLGAHSS